MTIRGEGALKAAAGTGLISVSGAACAVSAVTGTYGVDLTITGLGQTWTGERQYTQTAQLIEQTTGLARDQADQILELMASAGTAYAANKVLETTANALKLSDAQVAALRNEAQILQDKPPAQIPANQYAPTGTLSVSKAHSVETITPNTRWGGGDRNTPKTIALGGVDLKADLQALQNGQGIRLADGNIQAPSGRVYAVHPGTSTVYPISGPGLVQLTQAEFGIYKQMLQSDGLKGNALKALQGQMQSGNQGLSNSSQQRLEQLFNSRGN